MKGSHAQHDPVRPVITVVVTCFDQYHFLAEAIESVVNQTYRHFEIVVVDDGSTDDTSKIAARFPLVRYVRQDNQGLAAARNTGVRASTGDYLVFLDADDRLQPTALEDGLHCFRAVPECAFVHGSYRFIAADGSPLGRPILHRVDKDHYLELLRGNYIGMHATVMYRREMFDVVGGFDTSLPVCEDYDLYLRIARIFPIRCHNNLVAEYRRHKDNMSCNIALMLQTALDVLGRQWEYVKKDNRYDDAYKAGIAWCKEFYGSKLLRQVITNIGARGGGTQPVRGVRTLLHHVGWKTLVLYAPVWSAKYAVKQVRALAFGR